MSSPAPRFTKRLATTAVAVLILTAMQGCSGGRDYTVADVKSAFTAGIGSGLEYSLTPKAAEAMGWSKARRDFSYVPDRALDPSDEIVFEVQPKECADVAYYSSAGWTAAGVIGGVLRGPEFHEQVEGGFHQLITNKNVSTSGEVKILQYPSAAALATALGEFSTAVGACANVSITNRAGSTETIQMTQVEPTIQGKGAIALTSEDPDASFLVKADFVPYGEILVVVWRRMPLEPTNEDEQWQDLIVGMHTRLEG